MTTTAAIEQLILAMTRRERVHYLKAHGWHRLGSKGAQTWIRPGESWRFFTLAAAIRDEIQSDAHETLKT